MGTDHVLIRLRDVAFHYEPARPVLRDVSLELCADDRVGLAGPNGSGKTTLLSLVVGLLRPVAGEITIFGQARTRERDFYDVRTRVGLVFQDPEDQLFCTTVAEDVAFGPLNLGLSRDEVARRVADTLDELDLAHLADRVTYRLSFGEKKLVSLATVLAMQPEVLLLDEPTAGVDPEHEQRIGEILERTDRSMIVVSHDESVLDRLTHRRLVLKDATLHKLEQS